MDENGMRKWTVMKRRGRKGECRDSVGDCASFSMQQGFREMTNVQTCHVMVTFEPAVNFAAGVAVRKPLPQGDDLLGATALWYERFESE